MKTSIGILLAFPVFSTLVAWWSTRLVARHEEEHLWGRN